MPPVQRAIAVVVAILLLAGVIVVGLNLGGGGATASPDPTASASSAPTASASASAAAEPSASADEETLAILAEIEEQVVEIRGLPAADIGPPDVITRAELADELELLFEEEYPPEEQERDNLALRALGLLRPDQDVAELQLQLLGDQVLGFYDKGDERMVVVTDVGLDVEARLTYAHEYAHALQDAEFDFDVLDAAVEENDDAALALLSLKEGDATVTMLAWAVANLSQQELLQLGTSLEVPDTTGIPDWMVAQLQFPYNEGTNWAGALVGNPIDPAGRDFSALDAAYEDPPDSTEQIIDFASWPNGDEPVDLDVVDLAAALGDGWEEVDRTPIGQAFLRIMLEYFGVASQAAIEAGSGWGGDEVVIASGQDDAFALAWRLTWDAPTDADQFVDAYTTALDGLDFPATVMALPNGEVLVVHASSDEILAAATDAAD